MRPVRESLLPYTRAALVNQIQLQGSHLAVHRRLENFAHILLSAAALSAAENIGVKTRRSGSFVPFTIICGCSTVEAMQLKSNAAELDATVSLALTPAGPLVYQWRTGYDISAQAVAHLSAGLIASKTEKAAVNDNQTGRIP